MDRPEGMPTKDWLAQVLREHGLEAMADKAATGYYDDFLSLLDAPQLQLVHDIEEAQGEGGGSLVARVMAGEFDGTREEAEAWAQGPEGLAARDKLTAESARPDSSGVEGGSDDYHVNAPLRHMPRLSDEER